MSPPSNNKSLRCSNLCVHDSELWEDASEKSSITILVTKGLAFVGFICHSYYEEESVHDDDDRNGHAKSLTRQKQKNTLYTSSLFLICSFVDALMDDGCWTDRCLDGWIDV